MQHLLKYVYEGTMVLMVLATIVTLWTDNAINSTINLVVWFIFFIDFLFGFIRTKHKWDYIKRNPFLIIAIIPLDQFFQMARIVRLFYLFRIKTIAKYYITPYTKRLNFQSLGIITSIFFITLTFFAVLIWKVEDTVPSFLQGMYVVFSYLLIFGHRVHTITHTFSVSLLTVVSVAGVIVQGLALHWGLTKAEKIYHKIKKTRSSSKIS